MNRFLALLLILVDAPLWAQTSGSLGTPSPTSRGINREVYIAVRTDGRAGKGTFEDPFDGSTAAKFDAAFSNAVSTSAIVHLGPGTFYTAGTVGPSLRFPYTLQSYRIMGAGMDVTTLRLSPGTITSSNFNYTVLGQTANVGAGQEINYFELSDLTVDANSTNQFSITNSPSLPGLNMCVGIGAREGFIHHCRFTGGHGETNEAFICSLVTPANWPRSHFVISDCVADGNTGYLSTITVAGNPNPATGSIRNCFVTGSGDMADGQTAYGGWYLDGVAFENNFASGVTSGFTCDTFGFTNIAFRGNMIAGPQYGILINGSGTYDTIQITGNVFRDVSITPIYTAATPPSNYQVFGNVFNGAMSGATEVQATAGLFDINYFVLRGGTNATLTGNLTNWAKLGTNALSSSASATNTFDAAQFTVVNGTNVHLKSGLLASNLVLNAATEGSDTPLLLSVTNNATTSYLKFLNGGAVQVDFGYDWADNFNGVGANFITPDIVQRTLRLASQGGNVTVGMMASNQPAALRRGLSIGNGTAAAQDPTNAISQWSTTEGWFYRTGVASEGAGANNHVHNRTEQVRCYDTNGPGIVLTTTMTNVVFSETGALKITLPTSGTYDLLSQLEVYDNGTSFIQFWAQLWASNSVTQGVVPYSEIYEDLNFGTGSTYTRTATGTFTCTNATDIYVQCKEGSGVADTQLRTNRTKLRYIRLY